MQPTSQWLDLFNSPEPKKIFDLSQADFQSFVQYIFERAGYYVEHYTNPGAHLVLRYEGHTEGFVACTSGVHNVGNGSLTALNGIPSGKDLPKFAISSEHFAQAAYEFQREANGQNGEHLHLLDIDRLRRYISYVRGTRHPQSKNLPFSPVRLFKNESKKRPLARTKVLALANNKGGVSKTTSAFAIGLILATEKKKRVLFVDLDDQANLTQIALRSLANVEPNISHYFADMNNYPLSSLIRPTQFKNAWVIPSDPQLRLTLSNIVDWLDMEQEFTYSLHHDSVRTPDNEDFDWIILDTPPSLGLYTRAAIIAAHKVLAPFTPSVLDRAGLRNLVDTLDDISCITESSSRSEMLGIFPTRWRRTNASRSDETAMKEIAIQKGVSLFDTDIGINDDAANIRKLVYPEGTVNLSRIHGALDDYRKLVKEIQDRVHDN